MVVINNTIIFFSNVAPSQFHFKSLSDFDSPEPSFPQDLEPSEFPSLENFESLVHSKEASLLLMMIMIILQFVDTKTALGKALKTGSAFDWFHFLTKLGVFMTFVMMPLCELLGGACLCYAYGLDSYYSWSMFAKKERKTSKDLCSFLYYLGSNLASASGGMKHVFIVLNNLL